MRLKSIIIRNKKFAYTFDEVGNRGNATEAGTATSYATNALNQYAAVGDFVPEYDADGNATLVKTATGTWSVSYNAENRPVRFECTGTQMVVEMNDDSQGRRFEKKVIVAGTTTLHQRYIYRGFLQIAALNLQSANLVAAHYILWDPTQPTATRPLAIQTAGTWFVYGHDLTKNVMELFGPNGFIRNEYSYAPFGTVSATTDLAQPFQWSSEFYDSELALVYYNYRHYSPDLGRFLSRDPIEEQGAANLYLFCKNNGIKNTDYRGNFAIVSAIFTYKCIMGALSSMALDATFQLAACGYYNLTDKCRKECCKINYCSLIISGVIGCFSPVSFPSGQITIAVIKTFLKKWGQGFLLKTLGKLGC